MKILVISGFLGAGKTTFIKELARRTKQDFAVMENEYGAVGVDGGLLNGAKTEDGAPLSIWELTEGCICCTRKSDFATSILTIANTVDPEYLVVEPTGVGMLSKILDNIRRIQYERIELLAPVTILDGENFEESMRRFPDTCRDQIQFAKTVLISKRENASLEELRLLEQKIQEINPQACVCAVHYSKMDDGWWQNLLRMPLEAGRDVYPEKQEQELESVGLTGISLKSGNELVLFLQGLAAGVFGGVYRAKGYLKTGEAWLRFDMVDRKYTVTGTEPMEESRGVFIGKGLKRGLLREVLQKQLYGKPGTAVPADRAKKAERMSLGQRIRFPRVPAGAHLRKGGLAAEQDREKE